MIKDLPEGHNQPEPQEWEKEISENSFMESSDYDEVHLDRDALIIFIRSLLAEKDKEREEYNKSIIELAGQTIDEQQDLIKWQLNRESELATAKQAGIQEAVEALTLKWEPAHTYSSENADVYRAWDNGFKAAMEQLQAKIDQLKKHTT